LNLRLLGGLGIAQHQHRPVPEGLRRTYRDIDLVADSSSGHLVGPFLEGLGYVPNRRFNNLHGDRRLLFYDEANGRQVDVFIGLFRMCHVLDLDRRLDLDPRTVSPADLLLTKLQVVEINQKDLTDAVTLVQQHELGTEPADVLGLDRLTSVTRRDWGWFTTLTDNLARLIGVAEQFLNPLEAAATSERIRVIREAVVTAPKSLQWRLRAKVGRRVQWYELPEEVEGG
jgi:hypothetical protein